MYNKVMKKQFWGYNTKQEAESQWGTLSEDTLVNKEVVNVVDDPTKWPQTSSCTVTSYTHEVGNNRIAYSIDVTQ